MFKVCKTPQAVEEPFRIKFKQRGKDKIFCPVWNLLTVRYLGCVCKFPFLMVPGSNLVLLRSSHPFVNLFIHPPIHPSIHSVHPHFNPFVFFILAYFLSIQCCCCQFDSTTGLLHLRAYQALWNNQFHSFNRSWKQRDGVNWERKYSQRLWSSQKTS